MSELKVCRICLRTEAKMYHIDFYQLKSYYEEVIALKVNETDDLPHHFCYECASMLQKFHKFKEKCYIGQRILQELLRRGKITYESIHKIDRNSEMLQSPLKIINTSSYVKKYKAKDTSRYVSQTQNIPKIEMDSSSDASMSDREYFISEMIDVEDAMPAGKEKSLSNNDTTNNKGCEFVEEETVKTFGIPETDMNDENQVILEKEKMCKLTVLNEDVQPQIDSNEKLNFGNDTYEIGLRPTNIYVEAKSIIKTDNGKVKNKKKAKRTTSSLKAMFYDNKNHWKITSLNEEEALKEFRAKSEDKKYIDAAFKCDLCFRGFSKKDMLNRHTQLRHIEQLGKFECRFCHYRYKLECHRKNHIRQHYTRYQCLRCNLMCPLEGTAMLHEEYHSGITKKCNYCDQEFRHTSTYYTHLRTHRSEHVCTLCGVSFVSRLGLLQHKRIKHVIVEIESPDDDEEVDTYCKRCDIRFETRKAYEEHLFHSALHVDEEHWLDGHQHSEEDLKGKKICIKRSTEPPERVSASKKVLGKKEKAKIKKELRRHKPDFEPIFTKKRSSKKDGRPRSKPTTCYQCGKYFDTQAAYLKHHAKVHPRTSFCPPNERFICEICGASLAPGSIAVHQNMHTKQIVHTCTTCGRQFHTSISLKRHQLTHTGEKPYACPLCEKKFTQSNSMKLHYKTFHLKQPYPKRNRQKKMKQPTDAEESPKDRLPKANGEGLVSITDDLPRADDAMQYLTFT